MSDLLIKKLALYEELITSVKLIQLGFREYQNVDMANDFYHLPFQLISSGFERLMKCHICLGHLEIQNCFPESKLFKKTLNHNLLKIKQHIIDNYFKTKNIPALITDLEYLNNNKDLNELIYLLSEFGKFARYYNLDVVTGEEKQNIDVKSLWEEFEGNLLSKDKKLMQDFTNVNKQNEVYAEIIRSIIIKLERFVRAISRQFTLGSLGKLALQYSSAVYPFLMLMNSELGTKDYKNEKIL